MRKYKFSIMVVLFSIVLTKLNAQCTVDAGSNATIVCSFTHQLNATTNCQNVISYQWTPTVGLDNPNIKNPIAKPAFTTKYYVLVTTSDGKTAKDSVVITVNSVKVNVSYNYYILGCKESAQLSASTNATGKLTWQWTPTTGLSDPTIPNPVAYPSAASTNYTVRVTTENGCTNYNTVSIQRKVITAKSSGNVTAGCGSYVNLNVTSDEDWAKVSSGVSNNFYSIFSIDSTEAWAVGEGGIIMRYINNCWTISNDSYNLILRSVYFVSRNNGWVVGDNGTILHFDGSGWTKINSGTTNNLHSVYFTDANNGWIVGSYNTILRYNGTEWEKVASPLSNVFYKSVHFIDKNNGWAISDNAIIKYDGKKWSVNKTFTTSTILNCIWFVDKKNGWVGGNSGTMLYFNGNTWETMPSNTTQNIYSLCFRDTLNGWAIANNNQNSGSQTILKYNTDSWIVWSIDESVLRVHFTKDNYGWVVGKYGLTMRYNHYLKYEWTPTESGLTNPNNDSYIVNPLKTTTYSCTVTNFEGCSSKVSVKVTVDDLTLNAGTDLSITCGDTATIKLATNCKLKNNLNYTFTPDTTAGQLYLNYLKAYPKSNTEYTFTATSPNGCSKSDKVTVSINPFIASAPNDTFLICGRSVQLKVKTNMIAEKYLKYKWTPSATLNIDTIINPIATPLVNTYYNILIKGVKGCKDYKDTVLVKVNPLTVNAGADITRTCWSTSQLNATTNFPVETGLQYKWIPNIDINNINIKNPIVYPDKETNYIVELINSLGCVAKDTVLVKVNYKIANAGNDVTTLCQTPIKLNGNLLTGFNDYPSMEELIASISSVDNNNVWMVGYNGYIIKYNGKYWQKQETGITDDLQSVSFIDNFNGWAVGEHGVILKYNGTKWIKQDSITNKKLYSVFALSSNNVWVVGASGTIFQYDGSKWNDKSFETTNDYYCIYFIDKDNAWIGGNNGTLIKYDGVNFQKITFIANYRIYSFVFNSLNDGWLSCDEYKSSNYKGYIYKWDGNVWVNQPIDRNYDYRCLAKRTDKNIFAVGWTANTIMEYKNGKWEIENIFNSSQNLCAIHFSDSLNGWGAGVDGRMIRYVRSKGLWYPTEGLTNYTSNTPSVKVNENKQYIYKLSIAGCPDSQDTVLVNVNPFTSNAGTDKTTICSVPVKLISSGNSGKPDTCKYSWTPADKVFMDTLKNVYAKVTQDTKFVLTYKVPEGCEQPTDTVLIKVSHFSLEAGKDISINCSDSAQIKTTINSLKPDTVLFTWTPSTGLNSSTIAQPYAKPYKTTKYYVSYKVDDGCKQPYDSVTINVTPYKVSAGTDVNAICGSPVKLTASFNKSWSPMKSPVNTQLNAVFFTDSVNGWIVGSGGVILKYNGKEWIKQTSSTSNELNSLFFTDTLNGWAVGSNGTILKYDGINWTTQASGTTNTLKSVFFVNKNFGWAVGNSGTILKYDGNKWTKVTVNKVEENLNVVRFSSISDGFIFGDYCDILKYDGTKWTIFENSGPVMNYTAGDVVDAKHYYIAADDQSHLYFGSHIYLLDGKKKLLLKDINSYFYSIDMIDTLSGWLIANNNVLYYYYKNNIYNVLEKNFMLNVFFLNKNNGWIVGTAGLIYKYNPFKYEWAEIEGLSDYNCFTTAATVNKTTDFIVNIPTDTTLLTKNCPILPDTVRVNIKPITLDAGADRSINCGQYSTLLPKVNYSGTAKLNYKWYPETGLNDPNIEKPQAKPVITTEYTVEVSNDFGCNSATDNVKVNIKSLDFKLSFTQNQQVFTSPPFNVLFVNTTANKTNYDFQWDFGDGDYYNGIDPPLHSYKSNGKYTVKLIGIEKTGGCIDTLIIPDYIVCVGGTECDYTVAIEQSSPVYTCVGEKTVLSCIKSEEYKYQWLRNGILLEADTFNTINTSEAGEYRIIAKKGVCSVVSPALLLINKNSPPIPQINALGSISYCAGGEVKLDAPYGYNQYLWSNGQTTQSVTVKNPGTFMVTVINNSGCANVSSPYIVGESPLNKPDLCMVSVDDNTNKNIIIWEKHNIEAVDSFLIYKETNKAEVYKLLAKLSSKSFSTYIDKSSEPAKQANRYKIAIKDTCGAETEMSDYHKTMHLTINKGIGESYNLIWSPYEGFEFDSYYIYRGDTPDNMLILDTIASNLYSYTDLNPLQGNNYYMVEVINPNNCNPSKKVYNTAQSNKVNSSNQMYYTISGTVTYDNKANNSLNNVLLKLKNKEGKLISETKTDNNGDYFFTNLQNDKYYIECNSNAKAGGYNPVDALFVNRYYLKLVGFGNNLRKRAADVNIDNNVNPIDALMINRRYIGILKSFKSPDWLFETDTIELNGSDLLYNIKSLCAGDNNGSYTPLSKRDMNLSISTEGIIKLKKGDTYYIPLRLDKEESIGSVGLQLTLKLKGFTILDVKSEMQGMLYNITENGVNIAWSAKESALLNKAVNPLLYIKVKMTEEPLSEGLLELFELNGESIITDYEANTITNLKLVLPFLNTGAEAFTYKIYPNPAKESATLIYFLPEKTEIDFTIYDITGKKLRTIVKEIKEAGNSSVVFDTSSLNPGVYFYTIKTNRKQKTGKLIIM